MIGDICGTQDGRDERRDVKHVVGSGPTSAIAEMTG